MRGLKRTLDILDRYGIKHTGRRGLSANGAELVISVKGIDVGIRLHLWHQWHKAAASKRWAVSRIQVEGFSTISSD